MRLRFLAPFAAALVAAFFLPAAPASAQGVMQQVGPLTKGHLLMGVQNGQAMDAGGPTQLNQPPQNNVNAGMLPLGLGIVNSGLGNCVWSGYASAPYASFCWGFDGNGNALLSISSAGGAPSPTFSINLNGTIYPFPGPGTGNVTAPTSPAPTAGNAVEFNGGSTVKDAGFPPGNVTGPGSSVVGDFAIWNSITGALLKDIPVNSTVIGNALAVIPSGGTSSSSLPALTGRIVTPMDFGAKGDGTTDDTAAVQAAINYVATSGANAVLALDNRYYCVRLLSINAPLTIQGGQGGPGGVYNTSWGYAPKSGFKACAINQNLLNVAADGSDGTRLENFGIIMNAAGQNSSGAAIILASTGDTVRGLVITDPCVGISDIGNQNYIANNRIVGTSYSSNGTGCGGIQLGNGTSGGAAGNGASTDARITGNTIYMPGSSASGGGGAYGFGMLIENTGGVYLANNDIVGTVTGTLIAPGPGQTVLSVTAANDVLGDSTWDDDLTIAPTGGGVVEALSFVGDWFGSAGGWNFNGYNPVTSGWHGANNFTITPGTGSSIQGVLISGSRFEGAGDTNISLGTTGITDITISSSHLCNAKQLSSASVGDGLFLNGSTTTTVIGNTISPTCDGHSGSPQLNNAIAIAASNYAPGQLTVMGNMLTGNTNPLTITGSFIGGSSGEVAIESNVGVSDLYPSVTAAASISVGAYKSINLTGSTATISNISPAWAGRVLYISDNATSGFATGGSTGTGICAAVSAPGSLTEYVAVNTGACWAIK